jgi:hypothetical protein
MLHQATASALERSQTVRSALIPHQPRGAMAASDARAISGEAEAHEADQHHRPDRRFRNRRRRIWRICRI